ncbi:uracil-DNA glycosylase [Buchnera aphidicola]|uniref:uracil-DNA glycosylase n=1 Tax=Buchnera aphidicola TaxID=9 RepID=UPI0022387842|nr:uracil-DNA glycosylase [Buchnera aphidicola]MCW5197737.1 uracil-DNA glycosylase [Buchnera aphidicola (Chaitophorus viminalis)]
MYTWKNLLKKKKIKIIKILKKINQKRKVETIFPEQKKIFYAFHLTKFHKIKVVILGQDPYYKINQANGLAFSVNKNISIPPSLKNIFKEIKSDINKNLKIKSGCLKNWAKQGVFLLNSILTVSSNLPGSHKKYGWESITDYIIQLINDYHVGIIFLLWGSYAQKKKFLIDSNKHYILFASHPSPLSAYKGFFGCKHFSQVNTILLNQKKQEIDWSTE